MLFCRWPAAGSLTSARWWEVNGCVRCDVACTTNFPQSFQPSPPHAGMCGRHGEWSAPSPLSPGVGHKLHHARKTLCNHPAIVYSRRVTTATALRGWAEEAELLEEGRARRIMVGGYKQRALLHCKGMDYTSAFWWSLASYNWTSWSS